MSGTTEHLVEELRRRQVHLALADDRLQVDWPIDEVESELVERVRACEAELIAHLRGREAAPAAVACEVAPLSFAQQRIWFIDRLEGGSAQYHLPIAIRLSGALDRDALQRAFDAMLVRHEALRTVFELDADHPVQRVREATPLRIVEDDLGALDAAARQSRLRALQLEEATAPFDLGRDPMLRARLLRLGEPEGAGAHALDQHAPDEHVLLVTMHHIASDGWSIGIFVREFCALYAAFAAGRASPLPALPTRYAAFAVWQRERLSGDLAERQCDYWRAQLDGAPVVHDLPLDRKRPALQSFEGALLVRELDAGLRERLKALARERRCTLFMVLQAAFALLVHRLSGRDDVAMGVPVAGRTHEELEPLIGFFVNTLVLRSRLKPGATFVEFLDDARDSALAAYDHQEVPFEMLVERIKPERSRSHGPLFQLMFSMHERHTGAIALPGLHVELLRGLAQRVKCDLELEVVETTGGLALNWTYATALFDAATIERMHARLACLLQGIAADPRMPVARLPLLPPDEAALIAAWNATATEFPADDTLVGMFEASAIAAPEQVALVMGERQWRYGELNARASRLAWRLVRDFDVQPGALVGHCLERSPEMVVALLAIMKTGAAYVALDPGVPHERLAHMLADSAAPVVLTQARLASHLAGIDGVRVIVLGDEEDGDADDARIADGEDVFRTRAQAQAPAYVIYTSGSTGLPKGTLNHHRGPCNRIRALQRQFPLTADDRVLQKTPLGFDVSVWELFWPLSIGATVVLAEPQGHKDPLYLARTVARQRVTVLHFVPSMLQMFLRSADLRGLDGLRYLMTSGEALSLELQQRCIEAFPGVRLINHYGPTETGIEVTWWSFDRVRADRIVPIGRPIANNRIHVLDAYGQTAPIGVAGELHIGGIQVGAGYLNNPALTAERFLTLAPEGEPERVYRTGDMARWLPDGEVEYLGRLDGQVKLRGMRVELGEIERKAREHPWIEEAVVVVDGALADQRLLCYLVAKPEAQLDGAGLVAELRQFMARSLPGYMTQCRYVMLERLPLSPNGKVDRLALPRPDAIDDRPAPAAHIAPAGRTEQTLVGIWSERLGLARAHIGATDSFFEIGGNSLLSIAVQADIKRELGIEVAVADLFQYPTIQHLARFIDGSAERAADRSPVLQQAKDRLLRARTRRQRDA